MQQVTLPRLLGLVSGSSFAVLADRLTRTGGRWYLSTVFVCFHVLLCRLTAKSKLLITAKMLQDAGRVLCRFVLLVAGKEGKDRLPCRCVRPVLMGSRMTIVVLCSGSDVHYSGKRTALVLPLAFSWRQEGLFLTRLLWYSEMNPSRRLFRML